MNEGFRWVRIMKKAGAKNLLLGPAAQYCSLAIGGQGHWDACWP